MCVCKPVSLSPSPPPLSWHLWTACSSPPAHRALLIFAQPRIGQELTLNTGSHMDALHLNQGAGIQPLQMQDSTVRLIRPSACGKRALDVLHRRGGGAMLSGMHDNEIQQDPVGPSPVQILCVLPFLFVGNELHSGP